MKRRTFKKSAIRSSAKSAKTLTLNRIDKIFDEKNSYSSLNDQKKDENDDGIGQAEEGVNRLLAFTPNIEPRRNSPRDDSQKCADPRREKVE